MKQFDFTIFTPTYNRAYMLEKLYVSLKEQTCTNFEWIIVDDGSTDDTESLVLTFVNEDILNIKYIKKQNEGKHVAINIGVKEAKGTWFFIVDSDDIIVFDALEVIKEYCDSICNEQNYAGVVGLRGNTLGEVWATSSIVDISSKKNGRNKENNSFLDASPVDYRFKLKRKGDRAEVIKTEIMKRYEFPSFENEKFMSENWLWYSLSRDGFIFRWFDKIVYITEYLDDGLTQNSKNVSKSSSKSKSYIENFTLAITGVPFINKYKSAINYIRYGKFAGRDFSSLYKECNRKAYYIIAFPVAALVKLK